MIEELLLYLDEDTYRHFYTSGEEWLHFRYPLGNTVIISLTDNNRYNIGYGYDDKPLDVLKNLSKDNACELLRHLTRMYT